MALEEEFVITIPDAEAEKIVSAEEAINFIATHPQAK
jgi:acyl carrier protein